MAQLLMVNPKRRRKAPAKRRKASASKAVARPAPRRRRRAAAPAKRRTYRRNPIARGNNIVTQVKNSAIGAAGALGVDIAFAKLPIPDQFRTGMMAPAARGIVSLGIGMLVGKVAKNKRLGTQLAEGGITVALHDLMKSQVGKVMPLNGYDDGLMGFPSDGLLGMEDLGLGRMFDEGPAVDDIFSGGMGYTGAGNVFDSSGY